MSEPYVYRSVLLPSVTPPASPAETAKSYVYRSVLLPREEEEPARPGPTLYDTGLGSDLPPKPAPEVGALKRIGRAAARGTLSAVESITSSIDAVRKQEAEDLRQLGGEQGPDAEMYISQFLHWLTKTARERAPEAFTPPADAPRTAQEFFSQLGERPVSTLAEAVAESIPGTAAVYASTAIAPPLGVQTSYALASGSAREEALAAGATPEEAERAAQIAGVPNTLLEYLPAGRLMKRIFGKPGATKILKNVVMQGLEEGGTEAAQGAVDRLAKLATYAPETSLTSPEAFLEYAQQALVGGLTGGGLGGAGLALASRSSGAGPAAESPSEASTTAPDTPAAAPEVSAPTPREEALVTELTQERERRNVAEREARTDHLTGLMNRRGFEEMQAEVEADPERHVIEYDLNNFKATNDTAGHAAGDQALRDAAVALRSAVGAEGHVARLGGDEFVQIVRGTREEAEAVRAKTEEVFGAKDYGAGPLTITGSVGATLSEADAPLQEAKRARKAALGLPLSRAELASVTPTPLTPTTARTLSRIATVYTDQLWGGVRSGDVIAAEMASERERLVGKHGERKIYYPDSEAERFLFEGRDDYVAASDKMVELRREDRLLHELSQGSVSARIEAAIKESLPPAGDSVRLYRGESSVPQDYGMPALRGRWFSTDLSVAIFHSNLGRMPGRPGTIQYVDIPVDRWKSLRRESRERFYKAAGDRGEGMRSHEVLLSDHDIAGSRVIARNKAPQGGAAPAAAQSSIEIGRVVSPAPGQNEAGFIGKKEPAAPAFKYSSEAVEQSFQRARQGEIKPSLPARIWQRFKDGAKTWSRTYPKLEHGGRFAEAQEALRRLENAPATEVQRVSWNLKQAFQGLTPDDYELLQRKVEVDSLRGTLRVRPEAKLPNQWNPELLAAEGPRVDAAVSANPRVEQAIARLRSDFAVTRGRLSAALRQLGMSDEWLHTFGDDYFHHSYVDRMTEAESFAPGTGGAKQPGWRPHKGQRKGAEGTLNLRYGEVMGPVEAQMAIDATLLEQLARLKRQYSDPVVEQMKAAAKAENQRRRLGRSDIALEVKADTISARSGVRASASLVAKRKRELALLEGRAARLRDKIEALPPRAESRRRDLQSKLDELLYKMETAAEFLFGAEEGAAASAQAVTEARAKRSSLLERIKAERVTWRDMPIPEGYVKWSPARGNVLYSGYTLKERIVQKVLEGATQELVGKEDLHKATLVGAKPMWVLPQELAETLDEYGQKIGPNIRFNEELLAKWKAWNLTGNPRRVSRYLFRNIVGDAQKVLQGNARAFLRVKSAATEIASHLQGKAPEGDLATWIARGGLTAGFFQQEAQQSEERAATRLSDAGRVLEVAKQIVTSPIKTYIAITNPVKVYAESVLRYANYLEFLNQMRDGGGVPKSFGASLPEEVLGLESLEDRAYWLSNQLVGSYDQVSQMGRVLRRELIPFWSFQELNIRTEYRLLRNALRDAPTAQAKTGEAVKAVAKSALGRMAGAVLKSPLLVARAGKFLALAYAFEAMMAAWNRFGPFSDDDDELPEDVRQRAHITFGRDSTGGILYFDRLSAFEEARRWFGADEFLTELPDYLDGRASAKDVALKILLEPYSAFVGSIGPQKLAYELTTGRSLFPDPTRPREITDKVDYLFQNLGLQHEYRLATGKPDVEYAESWKQTLLYRVDPGMSDYYDGLAIRDAYLAQNEDRDLRQDALRRWKQAIRFERPEIAERYRQLYYERGGTDRGIEQSVARLHPLYGVPRDQRDAYLEGLSEDDRETVEGAIAYWEETFSSEVSGQ